MTKNHYEVLGLARDASNIEIKEAYLKLSKKLHPDVNIRDPNLHKKFVRIQEAYGVLSKTSTRNLYDSSLSSSQSSWTDSGMPHEQYWKDPSIYSPRSRSAGFKNERRGYYGNTSWFPQEKVPHRKIVMLAIGFMIAGALVHLAAMRSFRNVHQKHLDERDKRIAATLDEIRKDVEGTSREEQIQKISERMKGNDS